MAHQNLWGISPKTHQPTLYISHIPTTEREHWHEKAEEEGWTSLSWGPWQDPMNPMESPTSMPDITTKRRTKPLIWGIDPVTNKPRVYALRINEKEVWRLIREATERGWTHVQLGRYEDDGPPEAEKMGD